jgi:hypothetical protein
MIILHKVKNDPSSDELEERLNDLVLAYKTELHEPGTDGPAIEEGDSIIRDKSELEQWIQNLEKELKWQRSLSGDGCYIDPETGEIC